MVIKDYFGKDVQVRVSLARYYNGNICIQLIDEEGLPFSRLTTNLTDDTLEEGLAFLDTNNCPDAAHFVERYELGSFTGHVEASGFCVYPLYEFDVEKLRRLADAR